MKKRRRQKAGIPGPESIVASVISKVPIRLLALGSCDAEVRKLAEDLNPFEMRMLAARFHSYGEQLRLCAEESLRLDALDN